MLSGSDIRCCGERERSSDTDKTEEVVLWRERSSDTDKTEEVVLWREK